MDAQWMAIGFKALMTEEMLFCIHRWAVFEG